MRVNPRGPEVKAVVALLESSDFDSADALAKEIIKQVGVLFSERDWYAWVYRETPEASYISTGPFSSEHEAKKYAGKYVDMLRGQHMILPLYSSTAFETNLASYKHPSKYCAACSHSLIGHEHPRIQPKCAVKGCKCRKAVVE